MMGAKEAPARLTYDFDLQTHVPANHILREVDRILDVGSMRQQLAPLYSHLGRPSIDPELIIRMLVIWYVRGIRSEQRLCDKVHLNLTYRWFCRLDLNNKVPDRSTVSKYRHGKFRGGDLLRSVFEATVTRCILEGLVGGQGFAVVASLIEADVDRMNSTAQAEWDASAIDPDNASRAVREILDVLDEQAFVASTPIKTKFTSHSDPASQWAAARKGPAIFSYSNNYLIDTDHSVIVDVEATRSIREAEAGAAQIMIDRTEACFSIKPDWLVAGTAYGPAENLAWLTKKRGNIPFIPLVDKGERTGGTFSRSGFEWDEDNHRYTCPEGQHLLQSRRN